MFLEPTQHNNSSKATELQSTSPNIDSFNSRVFGSCTTNENVLCNTAFTTTTKLTRACTYSVVYDICPLNMINLRTLTRLLKCQEQNKGDVESLGFNRGVTSHSYLICNHVNI